MSDKHLSYFKVENFKRFQSFEMKDIGQFNLLVGDNNVGKTSVLEALCFTPSLMQYTNTLLYILNVFKRFEVSQNPIGEFLNKNIATDKNVKISFFIKEHAFTEGRRYELNLTQQLKLYINGAATNDVLPLDHVLGKNRYTLVPPLIPLYLGYSENLSELYSLHIQKKVPLRKKLIESLRTIIPGLIDFDIDTANHNALLLRIEDNDVLLPLATYGDGAIKLFRILLSIVIHNGQRLMIDEIDSGIHHSRFKAFWQTILISAKDNDVQLFATTHNLECVRYFRDVLQDKSFEALQQEAKVFRLVEHQNRQVISYGYSFPEFNHAIENENELR